MRLPPRWVVAVSFAVAAAILGDSLLYAVLPTIFHDLGLVTAQVGILLSANRFVRLASNPLAGWVVARVGVRGPFLAAVFVAALTTLAYASGLGFAALLAARALWGVCWSFLRLGGFLAALQASDDSNRGYFLGFFNGVTRFGSFVAVLAGGLLTDLLGFTTTVLLFTGATILGGIAVVGERPPRPVAPPPPVAPNPAQAAAPPASPVDRTLRLRIGVIYAAVFIHGLAISGLATSTLGLWLGQLYGPTIAVGIVTVGVATLTGTMLSARFLADFIWGPLSGHLSDRHGRRRLTWLAGGIEAAALFGLATSGGLLWTVVSAVVLFLAATALQSTLDATIGDLAPPADRAKILSWYATALDLGAATGPLIGFAISGWISVDHLYRGAGGLVVALGLVYWLAFRSAAQPAGERVAAR